jgi:glycosyltransferase involved in cell wall biosynthesis
MTRRIVVFFPHNPFPPRSGAHKRCLEILSGLGELGCRLTLVSSTLTSDTPWNAASVQALEQELVNRVVLHRPGVRDYCTVVPIVLAHRLRNTPLPIASAAFSPPGLRRRFAQAIQETSPDAVLINYAYWDRLLRHDEVGSAQRIIDTLDMVTLQLRMRWALAPYFPGKPVPPERVPDHVLCEDFFAGISLEAGAEEFRIFDRYDDTVAISRKEADLIGRHTTRTRVRLIPMTHAPCLLANTYQGPALFAAGNNPFNVQGYYYFVKKVLPRVRAHFPDFALQAAGPFCRFLAPAPGVTLSGFVPDLKEVYTSAAFVVCPVFGGTGQQIKVVEAMAHGVPVVALRFPAEQSPVRHGVNGLVAGGADEFAQHVCELWARRDRCRQLGEAARDTIAAECSRDRLLEQLALLVSAKAGVGDVK